MAISFNNKTYRNLEEQVLKNAEDNAALKEVAKSLKITGVVATVEDLPEDVEPGTAYCVGIEGAYFLYIRANETWVNFGEYPRKGDAGSILTGNGAPFNTGLRAEGTLYLDVDTGNVYKWVDGVWTGPIGTLKGEKGNPGSIQSGTVVPSGSADEGTLYLNTNTGALYKMVSGEWILQTNLKGPQGVQGVQGVQGPKGEQGIQGPQGERGEAGGFIEILGLLDSISELPNPIELANPDAAYLVKKTDEQGTLYHLYIQVGDTLTEKVWTDVGVFNKGTAVKVNDNYVQVFNADTKLDLTTDPVYDTVYTGTGEKVCLYVYGYDPDAKVQKRILAESFYKASTDATMSGSLVMRDNDGRIHGRTYTSFFDKETTLEETVMISKKYFDNEIPQVRVYLD